MKQSDSIKTLMPDLIKAQGAIEAVAKDSKNPHFGNRYADLSSLLEEVRGKLNSNRIVILQPVIGDLVETRLIHESGEWISDEGVRIVMKDTTNPQAQGSAITYAKRYGLMSFLAIPTEDDDGEQASDNKKQPQTVTRPSTPTTQPKEPIEDIGYECVSCRVPITLKVYDYSLKTKGKALCFNCQKGAA